MGKLFETSNLVFNQIEYENIIINKGVATFLIGPSGCGKSTLLRLFNASISPSSGDILYEGQNIRDFDTIKLRREILLAAQEVFLFDSSIKENFIQFYNYRKMEVPGYDKINEFLSIVKLSLTQETLANTMSGGERQRLYLAIFLSLRPKVLLLDEPTSALDKKTGYLMIESIIDYCKTNSITPIIITHDANLANSFSDNTIDFSNFCNFNSLE